MPPPGVDPWATSGHDPWSEAAAFHRCTGTQPGGAPLPDEFQTSQSTSQRGPAAASRHHGDSSAGATHTAPRANGPSRDPCHQVAESAEPDPWANGSVVDPWASAIAKDSPNAETSARFGIGTKSCRTAHSPHAVASGIVSSGAADWAKLSEELAANPGGSHYSRLSAAPLLGQGEQASAPTKDVGKRKRRSSDSVGRGATTHNGRAFVAEHAPAQADTRPKGKRGSRRRLQAVGTQCTPVCRNSEQSALLRTDAEFQQAALAAVGAAHTSLVVSPASFLKQRLSRQVAGFPRNGRRRIRAAPGNFGRLLLAALVTLVVPPTLARLVRMVPGSASALDEWCALLATPLLLSAVFLGLAVLDAAGRFAGRFACGPNSAARRRCSTLRAHCSRPLSVLAFGWVRRRTPRLMANEMCTLLPGLPDLEAKQAVALCYLSTAMQGGVACYGVCAGQGAVIGLLMALCAGYTLGEAYCALIDKLLALPAEMEAELENALCLAGNGSAVWSRLYRHGGSATFRASSKEVMAVAAVTMGGAGIANSRGLAQPIQALYISDLALEINAGHWTDWCGQRWWPPCAASDDETSESTSCSDAQAA